MPIGTHDHEPAIDVHHGVAVIDPYRWLEDRTLPETQEWLDVQKRVHDDYFSKLPEVERLRARVSEYLDVEVIEQPAKVGSHAPTVRINLDRPTPRSGHVERQYIAHRHAILWSDRPLHLGQEISYGTNPEPTDDNDECPERHVAYLHELMIENGHRERWPHWERPASSPSGSGDLR